jgi:hypothetical protein
MKKKLLTELKSVHPGDLVKVDWNDASVGRTMRGGGEGGIDVPVVSWGIFIGVLGQSQKHIVLAQNSFSFMDGYYDVDYIAVPVPWACSVQVILKSQVSNEKIEGLLRSFLVEGRARARRSRGSHETLCIRQERLRVHGR